MVAIYPNRTYYSVCATDENTGPTITDAHLKLLSFDVCAYGGSTDSEAIGTRNKTEYLLPSLTKHGLVLKIRALNLTNEIVRM